MPQTALLDISKLSYSFIRSLTLLPMKDEGAGGSRQIWFIFKNVLSHIRAYTAVTRGEKDEPDRCRLNPQDMSSVMELAKK